MPNDAAIPPPPWQRAPDRPSRRRRDPISRDAIVTAAIGLLDREGLSALSMRRLAEELGTGAASLYWHVGSKDGLLDLVMDEIIGEGKVPDPDPEHWQEQLKQVARDQRAASDYIASLPADRFPNLTTLAGEFAFADPDERFELLIEIFVDGLARRAATA